MAELEAIPVAQDEGVLDDVLELAHVAGEVVRHQEAEDLGVNAGDVLPLEAVEPGDEVLDEQRDVLAPLAQRRDLDLHDVDAVVEVVPEGALLDAAARGRGGWRRSRARRTAAFRVPPSGSYVPSWRTRSSFTCRPATCRRSRRGRASPLGEGEAAGLVPLGAGEGARLVAEELGLEQRVGQGRAVDGDERRRSPRALRSWMARARSSLPVPVSPWTSTVLSLAAIWGRRSKTRRMRRAAADEVADLEAPGQLLAQLLDRAQVAERLGAADDRPCSSRRTAVDTLIGMPLAVGPHDEGGPVDDRGLPLANVCRRAQSVSHRLARNTSQHGRPIGLARGGRP